MSTRRFKGLPFSVLLFAMGFVDHNSPVIFPPVSNLDDFMIFQFNSLRNEHFYHPFQKLHLYTV
jgi:hypothetical protein